MAKQSVKNSLPNFSDFIKTEQVVIPTYKPDQVVDRTFVMTKFEVAEGNFGAYVILHVTDAVSGNEAYISTSMESIMLPLVKYGDQITLPCNITIRKFGNSYQLT